MNPRAPIHTDAHDVAVWLVHRERDVPGDPLRRRLADTALDLLDAVAEALAFPATRQRAICAADRAVQSLRVELRVARDVGALSPGGVRHVAARLDRIGRQLGGWARSLPAPTRTAPIDTPELPGPAP